MPQGEDIFIKKVLTKITVEDAPLLLEYFKKANYNLSNYNTINILMWCEPFKIYKYQNKNWIFIISLYRDKLFVSMPLCEKVYFYEALEDIKAKLLEHKAHYRLVNFTKEEADELVLKSANCSLREVSNLTDYVYLTESLRTFEGPGLRKRRGCLNNFYTKNKGHYSYEELNKCNAKECLELLNEWKADKESYFINTERIGTKKILENWDKLEIKGGIIRIDNKVKAFIAGSYLSHDMCQINIEKGDTAYRGIYQVLLKEFLQREFLDVKYLNREDDMGDANMKSAKLAYDPAFLIKKYSISCKD